MSAAAKAAEAAAQITVAVLGAGSYGTALAFVAAAAGCKVMWFMRSDDQAKSINEKRSNPKRFSDQVVPEGVTASTSFEECVADAKVVLHAIPAQHTAKFLQTHGAKLKVGVPYVSTAKGIAVATHQMMSELIPETLRSVRGVSFLDVPLAYLSGPSFAKEMIANHPVGVVVASTDLAVANAVKDILGHKRFRVYTTTDVVGVEIGGALKNPLAIGAGAAAGLGFGQSTLALLVTRGCREMRLLSVKLGGSAETLAGLSGVGDLMLTCFSSLSRNNRFGRAIAAGKTTEEAVEEIGEVVEGFPTAKEAVLLAQRAGLGRKDLPLYHAIADVLHGGADVTTALQGLLSMPSGRELFVERSDK